jgi:hypothetical protein
MSRNFSFLLHHIFCNCLCKIMSLGHLMMHPSPPHKQLKLCFYDPHFMILTIVVQSDDVYRLKVNLPRLTKQEFQRPSEHTWFDCILLEMVFCLLSTHLHVCISTVEHKCVNFWWLTILCKLHRYWEPTYEDAMNLIARLPEVAAFIYRRYVYLLLL